MYQIDTWYSDELATSESGQNLTSLTKVKVDCLKSLIKDYHCGKSQM